MKLQRKALERDGSGVVSLVPTEPEDLWHVYNLISIGDRVTATAIRYVMNQLVIEAVAHFVWNRRVQKETSTGSTDSERVRVNLTIEVKTVDFDTVSEVGELRISGKTVEENKFVKVGSFHTLTLEPRRNF